MDRLKGLLLAIVLGYPLLVLVLKLVEWTGRRWWLWAWGALLAFQLLMMVLAPVLILPLFNKFTPLPEGQPARAAAEAGRANRFPRPEHPGDGRQQTLAALECVLHRLRRFRKIVLFDTLIQQLAEPELEAVLAHEIGHFKKKHIPKMLVVSALGSLAGFYLISLLAAAGLVLSRLRF